MDTIPSYHDYIFHDPITELGINFKMYTKIFDTRYKHRYEEYYHESTANIPIPFEVIEHITKNINMKTQRNVTLYNLIIERVTLLNNRDISFKIYKNDYISFRKIIIKTVLNVSLVINLRK